MKRTDYISWDEYFMGVALLAARRSGIKKVLMPHDNEKDLKEVPAEVLEDLEIVFVDHVDEVLPHALAASVEEIFSGRATAQPLYLSLRASKGDKDSSAAVREMRVRFMGYRLPL